MPRTPARGSGRPAVSRGVRGLSLGARRSPGDSLCRAAPDGSWSQGRLQNNGWRAGNAAWETGFGSAAASHGPLAPFLSLLQRALPTAISHGAAPRGWGCCCPDGLGHEAL